MIEVSVAEVTAFIRLGFDRMIAKAAAVPEHLNDRPPLEGANTIYQIVTHAMGATHWWLSHVLAGEADIRDRPSEFAASGDLEQLLADVDAFKAGLAGLVEQALNAGPVVDLPPMQSGGERQWPETNASVVLHVIEEVFQHAGHVDMTADLVGLRSR